MSEKVDILLAAYQGAPYLEEQLESILTQTHQSFHLWVRDDGSTDETLPILQKWVQAYREKITLIPSQERLGIKGNFSALMNHSSAPYVMFADQDDKWLSHKVESSLDQLKRLERQYGSHLPLVVHTDLKVVDKELKEISPSFCRYAHLNPDHTALNRLLSQNVFTGCTMLMNRALVDTAFPIPNESLMHDWWVGLVASCFGHIHFIEQPTILYRQHGKNDTGANPYSLWYFLKQPSEERKKRFWAGSKTFQQASTFLNRYQNHLPADKKIVLQAYEEMAHLSFFKRLQQMIKYQFFKEGFLRNLKLLITSYQAAHIEK